MIPRVFLSLLLVSAVASSSVALGTTFPRVLPDGVKLFGTGARDPNFFMSLDGSDHATIDVQSAMRHNFMQVEGRPQRTSAEAAPPRGVSPELPAFAATKLSTSLSQSTSHAKHIWRDTPPRNEDGTVNGYVEIARGDRNKWEFDMAANARAIDRVIPETIGGYPVNYGFVPQTVSYDGDPFDILVLGPPIDGGSLVRGAIVGLLLMNDEKGSDAKVVASPLRNGRPEYALTGRVRQEIADYFRRYKLWEPEKFSDVPGWGTRAEGLALLQMTHAFFLECRRATNTSCRIAR